jgi:hypothetical protein
MKYNAREILIEQFQLAIEKDEFLKSQRPSLERGYLTRFLRAGRWKVESAMEVLRSYSSLGKEYTEYVSRAIPSK